MIQRKNINRGHQKLIVWQDAADVYGLTCANGMKKLIKSLQYKREQHDPEDSFILKESNIAYGGTEQDHAS